MKRKVLVDLFYLNTALTGIKTYMVEFCQAVLENEEKEIQYIFTHDFQKQANKSTFRGNVAYWKKLYYHLYYFFWKQVLLPFRVWKEKPDVLICFDFLAPVIPLPTKKLVVVHDAFFWQMPQNYNAIWRKYFLKMFFWGIKGNTTLITTSNYSKNSLQRIAGITNPINVIYQCPKLLPETPETNVIATHDLHRQSFFLHVGSFDRRKLLPVLVQAFGIFDQKYPGKLKLVLAGEKGLSTNLDDYQKVVDKIKELNLEGKVIMTGFLSDESVKTLYKNALAYVFPSSNEGFGIPIIEAMCNGLPVILSDQEALVEVAGGAGLITGMGDFQDLAMAMETVYIRPEFCIQMIEKGYLRKNEFTRKAFYNEFRKHL
ncbi:glycosyltransferase family 1 protein [Rhodonellum sp.]|uniref:glycosyltransferase family 4 protein n=1 Tax=Rhodonellum sp. TaxID=2231180 RepID=UPI0027225937|nr:glycosyltransferase family 1 protein [Rhodonellum sp.]MDO9551617.1 glycosyltransferase family 1 protein [Rhodonellum sp.]